MVEDIKGGCPICSGDVKGTPDLKYYCPHCNILYDKPSRLKREEPKEEPQETIVHKAPIPLPPTKKIEFIDVVEGKVALTSIVREKGYLYFIDKKGDVSKVRMARSRAEKGPRPHYKVLQVGLIKEKGFLYFLDKDGDIARTPMQRN